jgi:hypothetical protein
MMPAVAPERDKRGSQGESKATYQYKGHEKSAYTLAIALLLPLLQKQISKQGIQAHNPVGFDPLVLPLFLYLKLDIRRMLWLSKL